MVEFTSGRIATQAWEDPHALSSLQENPVDQAVRAPERFRQIGQVRKEGVCTLSGRAIARALHDALPTSLLACGCDSCAESKTIASRVIDETYVHQCGSTEGLGLAFIS